ALVMGKQPITVGVSSLWTFLRTGFTGVSLFFILSAFLLSLPFLERARAGRRIDVRRFYARRALRILPLYWFVVAVTAVCCATQIRDVVFAWPHMLFLQPLGLPAMEDVRPYGSVWWSLGTEAQFYLLLPLLPCCLASRTGRRLGLAALAIYP